MLCNVAKCSTGVKQSVIPTLGEARGEPAANLLSNLASVSSLQGEGEGDGEGEVGSWRWR